MASRRTPKEVNHGETRRAKRRAAGGKANYMALDPAQLQYTIALVCDAGGALRFGYTRDGGAYAIGVYGDGEPYTEYLRPSDDIEGFLQEICGDFRGGSDGVEGT